MATANGTVKKTALTHFSRPRASGIIALELATGDRLVGVDVTNGERDIMLFTDAGKAIRFAEDQVRAMGRTARGVRGIKLKADQKVISLVVVREQDRAPPGGERANLLLQLLDLCSGERGLFDDREGK